MNDLSILDVLTQHNAYLQRLSSASINEILRSFDKLSAWQISKLRDLLDELSESERIALASANYTTPALKEIRSVLSSWQTMVSANLSELFITSAVALAAYESAYIYKVANKKAPAISGESLLKMARKKPYAGGQLVDLVFPDIAQGLRRKVEYALRDGLSSGQTNQQIIQRIKGTKKLNYADGILDQTRNAIDVGVRTARAHVSNDTYLQTWQALGFEYTKDVATLDGRTSKVCASRDGRIQKVDGNHQRPPYHPRCRTIQVGVDADGDLPGERPFVADDRPVSKIPKDQRDGKIGQVDANTNFKTWFERQDEAFQQNWLGPSRYELFKSGKYPIDRFVDPLSGKKFTLKELERMDRESFKGVGL